MAVVGTNWKAGLIRWKPHVTSDAVYSLAHLHPFRFPYQLSASSRYPETLVEIRVGFTIHCFTRSPGQNEEALVEARYGDGRENRIFDISRYQLSFALPGIIRSLPGRKCYFAKSENYLIVESQITADTIVQYGVFFDLRSRKLDGLKVIELKRTRWPCFARLKTQTITVKSKTPRERGFVDWFLLPSHRAIPIKLEGGRRPLVTSYAP